MSALTSRDPKQSLAIVGATILDGAADKPLDGLTVWIEGDRIRAVGKHAELPVPESTQVIDGRGKYVIPGLMDANVHLLLDVRLENLARHEGHYEDLIAEAAQVALKSGVTTVFDTWGPRQPLMAVRDQISAGKTIGSRIFCAGNIIGLDGPFSPDFHVRAPEIASGALVERVNRLWAENVGPTLISMTPDQVLHEVGDYLARGIDFMKYASSDHRGLDPSFLVFSQEVQTALVAEAHRAGLTAQVHALSVESLRIALQAGVDIVQHCDITGPTPVPSSTLELLLNRNTAVTVFPLTQRRHDWLVGRFGADSPLGRTYAAADTNVRHLIGSGVPLMLATDAGVMAPEAATDPFFLKTWGAPGEDNLVELGHGHFHWLKAMEEKGLEPMKILRAATKNIAVAYRKDKDLGTIEPGKIADLVILDRDPLVSAAHYRSIHEVIKSGAVVDRAALPTHPLLTLPVKESSGDTHQLNALNPGRYPLCC